MEVPVETPMEVEVVVNVDKDGLQPVTESESTSTVLPSESTGANKDNGKADRVPARRTRTVEGVIPLVRYYEREGQDGAAPAGGLLAAGGGVSGGGKPAIIAGKKPRASQKRSQDELQHGGVASGSSSGRGRGGVNNGKSALTKPPRPGGKDSMDRVPSDTDSVGSLSGGSAKRPRTADSTASNNSSSVVREDGKVSSMGREVGSSGRPKTHQERWRTSQMCDDYINFVGNMMYPKVGFGQYGYDSKKGEIPVERPNTLGVVLCPARRRSPLEKWSPFEVACFEGAITLYGKSFHDIQKFVKTKTTREVVEFYYYWKMTSHYQQWKKGFEPLDPHPFCVMPEEEE